MTCFATPLAALFLALPLVAQAGAPDITRVKLRATQNPDVHRLVMVLEPSANRSEWSTFQAAFSVTSAEGEFVGELSDVSELHTLDNGKYRVVATLRGAPATLDAVTIDVVASHGGGTTEQSLVLPLHGDDIDGMFSSQLRTNARGVSRVVTRTLTEDDSAAWLSTTVFGLDGSAIAESIVEPSSTQNSYCADLTFGSDPAGQRFRTSASLTTWDGQVREVIDQSDIVGNDTGDAVWQAPTAAGGDARMRFILTGTDSAVVCVDVQDGDVAEIDSVKLVFQGEQDDASPYTNPVILTSAAQLLRFADPVAVSVRGIGGFEQALLREDGLELDRWSYSASGESAGIQRRTHPIGLRLGISKGWDSNWYAP